MLVSLFRSLWLAVALGAICATFGCSGGSTGGGSASGGSSTGGGNQATPPSISNLVYSPNGVLQSVSGTGTINGTLNFTDSGGDVASLNVTIFDMTGLQLSTLSEPIPGVGHQTSGTIVGTFQVSTNTVGMFTFKLSVTDGGGNKSNELSGTFQVFADSNLATVVVATGTSPASLTLANGSLYWSQTGEAVIQKVPDSVTQRFSELN
jgi:hypothetical protein